MASERRFFGAEGLGLIIGVILLPIGAAASVGLMRGDTPSDTTVVTTVAEASSEPVTSAELVIETVMPETDLDDLADACGKDGLELVEREAEGTISELQQAALDALRAVCAEAEMPLPGPPAPPPIVQTVTVAAAGGETATAVTDYHGEDDDHYKDDEHDDDEHHEDAEHHEDEEHEKGDD